MELASLETVLFLAPGVCSVSWEYHPSSKELQLLVRKPNDENVHPDSLKTPRRVKKSSSDRLRESMVRYLEDREMACIEQHSLKLGLGHEQLARYREEQPQKLVWHSCFPVEACSLPRPARSLIPQKRDVAARVITGLTNRTPDRTCSHSWAGPTPPTSL